MRLKKKMLAWISLFFFIAGIVSAIHAVINTRTSTGAIAWGISLMTFPYVAVPAYWVFGRGKFNGYLEAFEDSRNDFVGLAQRVLTDMKVNSVQFERRTPTYDAVKGLTRTVLMGGNKAQLLVNGEATFDSIIDGISQAEKYVLVEFYIVHDDGLGRRLRDALVERAQNGVEVYFLYDELGSKDLPRSYKDSLTQAGVRVSDFNTTQGPDNRFQLNFRNHRKIVVVDGKSMWVGGHNVGDEYLGLDPEFSPWRDTHVRIDGPAAAQAQLVVLADWYWARREIIELDWDPHSVPGFDVKAMVIATGPTGPLETAGMFFVHALNSAQDRIWITAPYFVPDEAVLKALALAVLRGVDVRIMLPGKSDNLIAQMAADYFVDLLQDVGVTFCEYAPGFMHQKVLLMDQNVSMIGTHNFDNRSFRLNFEVAVLIDDEAFNKELEQMFENDFQNCTTIDPARLADKSFFWRFGVRLSRLLSPIL